jgi:hypothetical protein
MCNRIRGLKEWSEIPRSLTRSLINFEYNPNVAPTEQVSIVTLPLGKKKRIADPTKRCNHPRRIGLYAVRS